MSRKEHILLVEDDAHMRASCQKVLEQGGFQVRSAASPKDAESFLVREGLDLVVTDLRMPDGGGMEVLRLAREVSPEMPVVVITAYPTVQSAVEAFKSGVVDYLLKPFTKEQLLEVVDGCLQTSRARDRAELLRHLSVSDGPVAKMIGSDPRFHEFLADLRNVAALRGHVLIYGETGSGKEMTARAIHRFSKRAGGPFVVLNSAAMQDTLLEAEIFGYEKGAFTGAVSAKPGLLEQAHGGSLLLDEVAELTPMAQAKLLRCLEEKACRRVGGLKLRPVDTRILAATHKDLQAEVEAGRFRKDMFFRLSAIEIRVPALRERATDIPQLAVAFLDKLRAEEDGLSVVGFSDDALDLLTECDWPGNVRELNNAIQKALVRARGPLITRDNILAGGLKIADRTAAGSQTPRNRARLDFEREHITEAIKRHGGNITHTAKALGIHRTTLQRLMRRLGIRSGS